MELQTSVNTSTNLPPLSGVPGPRERLKSTAVILQDCAELRQWPASPHAAQHAEQAAAASESAAKQPSIDNEFAAPRAANDYSCATDDVLVAAAKSSDGRAFEELSSRHVNSIRGTVYRIVRNLEDTEDVMQDSLLKAYCNLPEFKASCKFSTWVTKIAINSALMLLRKRKARPEASLIRSDAADQTGWDIADPSSSIELRLAAQEARALLSRAVETLPASYRNVLEQFHLREKSVREAADTLGISIATAKSRLFRARRTLRSKLKRKNITASNGY